MAFLENKTRIGRTACRGGSNQFRLRSAAAYAGSSTGWVCLLLAILGLGGGMTIALLSFGGSEALPRVSRLAPELRYLPPTEAMLAPEAAVQAGSGRAEAESSAGVATIRSFAGLDSSLAHVSDAARSEAFALENFAPEFELFGASPAALDTSRSGLGALAGNFAAAPATAEAASEGTFEAVMLPVPEPSTWAMMLIGAGVLLARLRPRRAR